MSKSFARVVAVKIRLTAAGSSRLFGHLLGSGEEEAKVNNQLKVNHDGSGGT